MSRVRREVLYQVSDHAVLGVNWRPMRLVDEVPREHVCEHCYVIPRRTSLLPCEHALCDLCREGSTSVGSTVCPVCKQSCGEEELKEVLLPEGISSSLKAHCWNEEKGCEFFGTVETLLQHYEEACEFRSFQCTVSGETVFLKDIPAHCDNGECVATCEASTSSSDANAASTRDTALSMDDVRLKQDETEKQILEYLSATQAQTETVREMLAKQTRKLEELQRRQAEREHQSDNGLSRRFGNFFRRSFRKLCKAASSRQQTPAEPESFQRLVESAERGGEPERFGYDNAFQEDVEPTRLLAQGHSGTNGQP